MKMEQNCSPFYGQKMVRARYYHKLRFMHFKDSNRNGVNRTDDRLWKIRNLFEIVRQTFQNFTAPPNILQYMKSW